MPEWEKKIREMLDGTRLGTPDCEVVSPETLRPCGASSIIRYLTICPDCRRRSAPFICAEHKRGLMARTVGCYYCRSVNVQVKVSLCGRTSCGCAA